MRRLLLYGLGCLWACTTMAQGFPFLRNFSSDEYRAHNINFDIKTGKGGTVYAANFEGLLFYDNESWHVLHTPRNRRITVVYRDQDSTIWVGGYNFFGKVGARSNGEPYLQHIGRPDLFRGEVLEIWERDGQLRFVVTDGKVYQVKDDNVTISKVISQHTLRVGMTDIIDPKAIDDHDSIVLLTDCTLVEPLDNGMKAIVRKGQGVTIANAQGRECYILKEENGLETNNVSWVAYNGHGLLWGATENGIFSLGYPSAYTHFSDNEGLRGDVISIGEYKHQKYVGTVNGLFRQEGKRFVNVGGISHACWTLALSDIGLLAATSNGIFCVTKDGNVKQLANSYAIALLSDGDQFYSGEIDGVYLTKTSTLERQKISNVDKATKIIKDFHGTIWIQSMYGEVWYKPAKSKDFKPYKKTQKEGLATLVKTHDKVYYIETGNTSPFTYPFFSFTDNEGVTWLTDNKSKGLYRWKDGRRLTDLDHLLSPLSRYDIRAVFIDGDEVWLGTNKGLVIIKTSAEDAALKTTPQLMIRHITLGGDSTIWGGFGTMPKTLPTLSSNTRNLHFIYSLDYEPLVGENLYRHRLNDGKWSAWADDHDAEFLNLPYGNYIFQVQARDAFGRETAVTEISFCIDHPFYLKWYMNLLYLILLGLLIATLVQWRLRKLHHDKLRLEKLVEERTEEVRRTHKELVKQEKMATVGKLTKGLIDRILNPLNYINNFSKLSEGLVKDIEANIEGEKDHMNEENYEDTMDVLGMLSGNLQKVSEHGQNTTRTLKAMEEILKDHSGGIVKTDLCSVLHQNEKMVNTYYQKEIQEHRINVTFDYPDTPLYVNANPELLSKTFMSLLGNSIYYLVKKAKLTAFKPEVSMKVTTDEEKITFVFYDNGVGIEDTIINKIFDPFFTTKTTGEAAGIGLYLSHDVIQNYGGNITVKSVKNEFTEFTVTLPAFKE